MRLGIVLTATMLLVPIAPESDERIEERAALRVYVADLREMLRSAERTRDLAMEVHVLTMTLQNYMERYGFRPEELGTDAATIEEWRREALTLEASAELDLFRHGFGHFPTTLAQAELKLRAAGVPQDEINRRLAAAVAP